MTFRRRCVALACAGLAFAWPARAADVMLLPAVAGELEGDFTPLQLAGAPTLHWKLAVRPGHEGLGRRVEIMIDGPGTRLKAEAELTTNGWATWRVTEGQIDLGPWFAAVAPLLGEQMQGFTAAGAATITAEGTWRGGQLGGKATLMLRDGRFENVAQKILFEGVALDLALEELAPLRSAPGQQLTWTRGNYDVVALDAGKYVFSFDAERLEMQSAAIGIFGGRLSLDPFGVDFAEPELTVAARVEAVAIEQILPYLPTIFAAARGRVDGSVELTRAATGGISIGKGRLALRAGETAEVRLAPTPGLISGSLPPAVLKYYPGFGQVETGQIPLQANLLEMEFNPDGDAIGRSAYVRLGGGPVDPKLRAPIDLTINVRGPLDELVQLGTKVSTNPRLKFGKGK